MESASGTTSMPASAADNPSSEPAAAQVPARGLRPAERLCILGVAVVVASLILPWYDVAFTDASQTALDVFGFAHAALLVTLGAAVALILRAKAGYVLPRPFSEGVLLAVAGAWACVLVAYLILDRPEQISGSTNVDLRIGGFAALGGAIVLVVGGLRVRRHAQSLS